MSFSIATMCHQFFTRQAKEIDAAIMEAMEYYQCGPELLAIQYELDGMVEVVTIRGPKMMFGNTSAARPWFKELRFEMVVKKTGE